jgi:hypothetical protein
MDTIQARLERLQALGIQIFAEGSDLKVTFDEGTPAEKIDPILDKLRARKSEILIALDNRREIDPRIIDGHEVKRIVWETEKAIIFEDEKGHFWRRLHAYNETWSVIVG